MKRLPLLMALAVLLFACDSRPPTDVFEPQDPSDLIQDATHNGGNPAFHWLPPVVQSAGFSGVFNGQLSPRLEICELADAEAEGAEACAEDGPVWVFDMGSGPAEDPTAVLTVSPTDEHYRVNWHTKRFELEAEDYRLIVYLSVEQDAPIIGVADVALAPNRAGFSNLAVDPDETIPLVDGQTLPAKFRIEKGVSCGDPQLDCGEGMTDPDSDVTITTASGRAGVFLPAGSTNEPVLVTIQESTRDPCLPTGLSQDTGTCYDYDTSPALTTDVVDTDGQFNSDVTVGICPTPGFDPFERALIHKYDPEKADDGVVELEDAPESFLTCPESVGAADGLLGRFAEAVRSLLSPRALFARDKGRGGVTDAFSYMTWATPAELALASPLGVVSPGATIQPTILATTAHNHGEPAVDADGTTLRFELTDPTGATQVEYAVTADGEASPTLTLTSAPGIHTLTVSTRQEADVGGVQTLIGDPTTVLLISLGASDACDQATDCVEQVVGPEGAVVVTPNGFAGVDIPADAVDGDIVVTIRQVDGASQPWGQCLPTGLRQVDYCYEFDTEPALDVVNQQDAFNEDVTVGVCVVPGAIREEHLTLHKYDPDRYTDGVVELEGAETTFLSCDIVVGAAKPDDVLGRLGWAARRALDPVVDLVAPRPLYARDKGRGGVTDAFSFIGWAEPVTLAMDVQPDATTAGVVDVVVTATTAHNYGDYPATLADGHTIRFAWTDPADATTLQHVVTDADGEARLSLAPPSPTTAGTHTVAASTRDSVQVAVVALAAPPSAGGFLGAPTLQDGLSWFLVPDPTEPVQETFEVVGAPGTIEGQVVDQNGSPLPGVQVAVQGTALATLTNASGTYTITNVPAGLQTVSVSALGFENSTQEVTVPSGGTVVADFQLVPLPAEG